MRIFGRGPLHHILNLCLARAKVADGDHGASRAGLKEIPSDVLLSVLRDVAAFASLGGARHRAAGRKHSPQHERHREPGLSPGTASTLELPFPVLNGHLEIDKVPGISSHEHCAQILCLGRQQEVAVIVVGTALPPRIGPKLRGPIPHAIGYSGPWQDALEVLVQLPELPRSTHMQETSLDFIVDNDAQIDGFTPPQRAPIPIHNPGRTPQQLRDHVSIQKVGHCQRVTPFLILSGCSSITLSSSAHCSGVRSSGSPTRRSRA